ncbi:MAG TPA: hypothetical protein DEA44_09570 [Firmicutes bacterium]|nr:hypothetical protein [Bacillota bacterium]
MSLKKIILPGLCLVLLAATAQAAPLTNFDTYKGSVDLGVWRTDVSLSDLPDPYSQYHQYYTYYPNFDLSAKWRVYGGITYGLNDRWGIQYRYHSMAGDAETTGRYIDDGPARAADFSVSATDYPYGYNLSYKGNTQELNLLYSLKKDANVALFVGVNRVHNEFRITEYDGWRTSWEGTRTHFQGGLVGKAPLSEKVNAYGLVGFGSHGLFQAETGLAFKMKKDWEANIGYRWFRVNDAFDEYKDLEISRSIDGGKVKVKGIKFGVTHYFGHAKAKETVQPPVEPPVVVQPPVEPPVVVQPPVEQPKKIILKGVNFDFDMDTLQPQSYPVLNNVVDMANNNPQRNFLLVGHTDSRGSDEYNMDLSMRRVKTVQRYLVSQGVAETRLAVDWKGEREPIATNDTDEGRAENRRVELHIK